MTKPTLRRDGMLSSILIPQLCVLALYLLWHFQAWSKLGTGISGGLEGFSNFFFEIVSQGASWAMLSLGTLMFSIALHNDGNRQHFLQFMEACFPESSAGALATEMHRVRRQVKIHQKIGLAVFTVLLLVGLCSVVGALFYMDRHGLSMGAGPIEFSFGALVGVLAAGAATSIHQDQFRYDNYNPAALARLIRLDWTPGDLQTWDTAHASGRLDEPGIESLFIAKREKLLSDEAFAAAYQALSVEK